MDSLRLWLDSRGRRLPRIRQDSFRMERRVLRSVGLQRPTRSGAFSACHLAADAYPADSFDVAKAGANLPLVVRLTGSDGTGRNAVSRSAARFALAVGVAGREVELLSAAVGTRGVRSDRCSGHSGADTTALLPVAQPTVSQENGSQLSGDS